MEGCLATEPADSNGKRSVKARVTRARPHPRVCKHLGQALGVRRKHLGPLNRSLPGQTSGRRTRTCRRFELEPECAHAARPVCGQRFELEVPPGFQLHLQARACRRGSRTQPVRAHGEFRPGKALVAAATPWKNHELAGGRGGRAKGNRMRCGMKLRSGRRISPHGSRIPQGI